MKLVHANGWVLVRVVAWVCVFLAMADGLPVQAQQVSTQPPRTGKQLYEAGCVGCHGPDGSGQSQSLAGFERPATFPDFTDCPTSTVEADRQWRSIISNGGPARAFSEIMPSFKDLLTQDEITRLIEHLRSLCTEASWPRGNLNLPRPQVTEKAFPENEAVIQASANAQGVPGVGTAVVYEKRIGATGQIEAVVPYEFTHAGGWDAAFGDIALGYKRKLFHSLKSGSILSFGGEVIAPTGDPAKGTGGESTRFETFGAFGQLLPSESFFQLQSGVELPVHPDNVPRAYYLRTALGKSFSAGGGFGRRWTPMTEFIADRDIAPGAKTNWDILPELQIPLSKRMHILGNVGIRIPVNHTRERPRQLMFYVLWDWMDGGLTEGW